MTTLLTEDEILARKQAQLEAAHARSVVRASASRARTEPYRYVKPFSDSYAGVLEAIGNPDQRFQLGLREVDMLTRGFGPKELVLITGFSHAGKTQLVNTAILNNMDRRILFFSMDDPSDMILLKLTCMSAGVDAETLEQRSLHGRKGFYSELQLAHTCFTKPLALSIGIPKRVRKCHHTNEIPAMLKPIGMPQFMDGLLCRPIQKQGMIFALSIETLGQARQSNYGTCLHGISQAQDKIQLWYEEIEIDHA